MNFKGIVMNHEQWAKDFVNECAQGNVSRMQWMLTDVFMKKWADVHASQDAGFRIACFFGHEDAVKYLLTSPDLKEHADIHAKNDNGFVLACKGGALNIIKYILMSPDFKEHSDLDLMCNSGFLEACKENQLHVIQYLLTSPDLKKHVDVQAGFVEACEKGQVEVVKYLLTFEHEMHQGDQKKDKNPLGKGFLWACEKGQLDVVKYLLSSQDVTVPLDIHFENDLALHWACLEGHLEVVKYLLTSPDLKEYANVYGLNGYGENGFNYACKKKQWNVIQWLIMDYGIEKTAEVEREIQKYPQIQEWFRVKEELNEIKKTMSNALMKNNEPLFEDGRAPKKAKKL